MTRKSGVPNLKVYQGLFQRRVKSMLSAFGKSSATSKEEVCMGKFIRGIAGIFLAGAAIVYANQDFVPRGTNIEVRTIENINMHDASDGRIFRAEVARDVMGQDGKVVIPRGADAELIVRNLGDHDLGVDLESIIVDGRRYRVTASQDVESSSQKDGVGANKRTGKFVGGGALLGTIIGAIGGGGKGAAIGALAGGAAGAGTQTLTRGRNVKIPVESVLTFRLNRDLPIFAGPDGYMKDGHHYH
jgi:hypothetical protein